MKYYYDVHVNLERQTGYSVGIISDNELTDEEVISLAVEQNKFEEVSDKDMVDYVENITEEDYNEWFSN